MNLKQRICDRLRDILKKRIEMKATTQTADHATDTPKDMGQAKRNGDPIARTTYATDSGGVQVCGKCGGEIVEVNVFKHTRACFDCGARVMDE